MLKSAAVYARYSTDRQDARSIDDQFRRCESFAKAEGFKVVERFADKAQSGAHSERADLQKLIEGAHRCGGSPYSAVIVDDLSRLSRDLGATWRIVFEDLASVGVKVVDATTRQASDGPGARLIFGAQALANDAFLQLVKTETHRGLEGRALAGFWTGGRVYGYATVKEPNPPDPEHPRFLPKINPAEARVVRRVFALYAKGKGLASIADALNRDGIPAPYDRVTSKKRGRGWGPSTIRAMLQNRRYIGKFVWNRRKFIRIAGRKNRRAVERPPSEWRIRTVPDLAIVKRDVWERVRERFKAQKSGSKRGRPLGASRAAHLMSGVARCGVCGASMGITGSRTKAGTRYATFGCSAHYNRGSAICANNLTVSELRLNEAVVGAIRDRLLDPAVLKEVVARFGATLRGAARRATTRDASGLDRDIAAAERAVRNLADAVARRGLDDALEARLAEEEARLRALKARKTACTDQVDRTLKVPSREQIEGYVKDLLKVLTADPERGRELLRRHVGSITMTPEGNGREKRYQISGAFDLSVMVGGRNDSAPVAGGRSVGKQSCGGPIRDQSHGRIPFRRSVVLQAKAG